MKKGFTLVELMASIIILSMITLIGVGVYKKVDTSIKEKEYKNKIVYIESQAALYASETGILSTNVDHLIELGYVEADNDNGDLFDPRHPKDLKYRLNNYIVTITKDGENYYGHFIQIEESDYNNIDKKNANLEIIAKTETGKTVGENKWVNEDVLLSFNITNPSKSLEDIETIKWYNNLGETELEYVYGGYKIHVEKMLNTTYRLELIFKDGIKYEAEKVIKIDKQNPFLYDNEVKIDNKDKWTNTEKKVTIIGTDQSGSGIDGYYIGENANDCTSNKYVKGEEEKTTNEIYNHTEAFKNGTYYVCARDKAGNISDTIDFTVENVDIEPPTCEITVAEGTMGENSWYTSDVKFALTTSDEGSGVLNSVLSQEELTKDTSEEGTTITGTVRDKAGNEGTCNIKVKRDATPPTCEWSGENDYWTNIAQTINLRCKDEASGCKYTGNKQWIYNSGTYEKVNLSYEISDKAGNKTNCEKTDVNVYVDTEKPECWNRSYDDWTKDDRTIAWGCKEDDKTCNIIRAKTFNQSTDTYNINGYEIKDKAGNINQCGPVTVGVKVDKEGPEISCESAGKWSNISSQLNVKITDLYSGVDKEGIFINTNQCKDPLISNCLDNNSGKCYDLNGVITTSYFNNVVAADNVGNKTLKQGCLSKIDTIEPYTPTLTNIKSEILDPIGIELSYDMGFICTCGSNSFSYSRKTNSDNDPSMNNDCLNYKENIICDVYFKIVDGSGPRGIIYTNSMQDQKSSYSATSGVDMKVYQYTYEDDIAKKLGYETCEKKVKYEYVYNENNKEWEWIGNTDNECSEEYETAKIVDYDQAGNKSSILTLNMHGSTGWSERNNAK